MPDLRQLERKWLHASEEGEGDRVVFRPATRSRLPSRGRSGYQFHPDGRVTAWGPGPDDRRLATNGTWSVDADGRLEIQLDGRPSLTYEVVSLDEDTLELKTIG